MSEIADGIRSRLGAILYNIFKREKFFVIEKKLDDNTIFETETGIKVNSTLVRREEFPRIASSFKTFKVNVGEILKDGDICAIAEVDGNLVNWTLIAFDEAYVGELQRKIRVSRDSAYLYAFYTAQNYRGLGIASKTMERILRYLHKRGIRKAYALVRHDNLPSLKYTYKAGFRKIGTIEFIKIYKLKLYKYKGKTQENYNTIIGMLSN